jgi:hypothetical protein
MKGLLIQFLTTGIEVYDFSTPFGYTSSFWFE